MVDDILLNSGTGGDTIGADDIGGIKYPRQKIIIGNDGTNDGDVSSTNPLPVETPNLTASGALGALNAAVTLSMLGVSQAAWEVDTGNLVGTVSFEATLDDTNWFAVDAIQIGGTIVTSITSFADRGHLTSSGWSQARLRVSAYTSGTSNARMEGSSGSGVVRLGDSIPTGSNTIGDVTVSSLPNEGQQTMANSISVTVASNQSTLNVDGSAVTQPISAASLPLPTGAATSANQLPDGHNVTVDNAAGASAVNIQDGGNSITVDGTVTANAGTGTFTVDGSGVTQPVSGTITASNTAGDVAHDTADSGNPVKVGGVADSTEPAAVADGDRVNFLSDLNGKQVVMPYAVPERLIDGATAAITGTSNTSVIASPGAGLRNYITHVLVTNSHATVGTVVELKDGTTVLYRGYAREDGGGFSVTLPNPLRLTAATAFNAANVTTGANTYVSASGFIAP